MSTWKTPGALTMSPVAVVSLSVSAVILKCTVAEAPGARWTRWNAA